MADASTKAYLFYVKNGAEGESYLLTNVMQETFMGMSCVRGLYHLPEANWHFIAERIFRIPLDCVQRVIEYESLEDYRAAVKRHYEKQPKRPDRGTDDRFN